MMTPTPNGTGLSSESSRAAGGWACPAGTDPCVGAGQAGQCAGQTRRVGALFECPSKRLESVKKHTQKLAEAKAAQGCSTMQIRLGRPRANALGVMDPRSH